jgi:hypothetical protein
MTSTTETDRTTAGGDCDCRPAGKTIFSSPEPAPDEPIVCTADLRDKPAVQAQLDGYRAVFAELRGTERFAAGFRWVFAPRAGLESELRTLAEKEHRCCRFFKFDVRDTGESLVWEVRADERAAASLEEFAALPTWLAQNPRGQDVVALKQRASDAGLVFAADLGLSGAAAR